MELKVILVIPVMETKIPLLWTPSRLAPKRNFDERRRETGIARRPVCHGSRRQENASGRIRATLFRRQSGLAFLFRLGFRRFPRLAFRFSINQLALPFARLLVR